MFGLIPENYYYKLIDGEIVTCNDLLEWAAWFETAERQVFDNKVGGMRISTVFLGIDHGYRNPNKPVLFETMIFGDPLDMDYQTRCSELKDTEAMHNRAVELAELLFSLHGKSWRRAKKAIHADVYFYRQRGFRRYYGKNKLN